MHDFKEMIFNIFVQLQYNGNCILYICSYLEFFRRHLFKIVWKNSFQNCFIFMYKIVWKLFRPALPTEMWCETHI